MPCYYSSRRPTPLAWFLLVTIALILLLGGTTTSPTTTILVAATEEEVEKNKATTKVEFNVNLSPGKTGTFVVEVHPDWAPLGAKRFLELVELGDTFWKGVRFFRVIEGFMAQFGIPGKPAIAAEWKQKTIPDDQEVIKSNERGYISFATSGKDSRTTQLFINLVDNKNLDGMGFAPFGVVIDKGMDVVDALYAGYGEGAPNGNGPDQSRVQLEGNKYLKKQFPNLSYVKSVRVVDATVEEEL